jgi:hypothetical protein
MARTLTATPHPVRQAVGHAPVTVTVGVYGQRLFGPGIVSETSLIHSGIRGHGVDAGGGQLDGRSVVVAV